jgi:LysM repeat protein
VESSGISQKELNMSVNQFSHLGAGLSGKRGKAAHWLITILFITAMLGPMLLTPRPVLASNCQAQHTVKVGDTLGKIGNQYGISWRLIAQANGIANPNVIYVGQVLCIPSATTPPPATCTRYHTVRYGETLHRIALSYGLSWTVVAQANNLANPNLIYAGQRLCIPSGGTTPPGPPGTVIPTFTIVSVVANQSVTIRTSNFPANQQFDVRMGLYGTQGVNGTWVASTPSGGGGSFTATYTIPANLRGLSRIAIRLQSPSGYYSYNWFHNSTTP